MNTFTGPFRLMMKEMSMTFYINTAITFVLFLFFNFLGFFDVADSGTFFLFGPLFIVFLLYGFINFKGYQYIVSLGGTRQQFVLAFYLSGLIFSLISVVLLNLFYYLSTNIFNSASTSVNFFHFANLVNTSNGLVYLWVDLSWILFVFSLGMIAKTIWFNYGTILSLLMATILLIISTIVIIFSDMSWLIDLFFLHHLAFVSILFGLSLVFLLSSYLVMKNAPLEKGNRLIFRYNKSEPIQ